MTEPVSTTTSSILFDGEYTYRTWNGTMAVFVSLLVCAIFGVFAVLLLGAQEEPLAQVIGSAFGIAALIPGGRGFYALIAWLGNWRDCVQIDDEGITYRDRFIPWTKIRSFHGTRFDNGICLGHFCTAKFFWGDGSLPTTPLLTEQEYVDLARRLQSRIGKRFQHVQIELCPTEPFGAS